MINLNKEISAAPLNYFRTPQPTDRLVGHNANDLNLGAFVTPNDTKHNVVTGNAFFNKVSFKPDKTKYNFGPATKEERARLLTHEMSHFYDIYKAKGVDGRFYGSVDKFDKEKQFGKFDFGSEVYGEVDSKALSQSEPKQALNHADSFSYFVSQQGSIY